MERGSARWMETVEEDVEEYSWREVVLPHLVPVVPDGAPPELERETGERRRGRDLLVAVDFGPNSKHAFDWSLAHIARMADTVHLVHAVSSLQNEIVYDKSQELMEDLAVEAFKTLLVPTKARIVEGDAGKVICREADRLKPAAVILGTRGRGLIKSVLQGSVSEYCFHNCKAAPIIIVPGKEAGEQSVL
ncbi:universal stress protein PHOS32-like [Miscanthus floridulus]|uniref:universal stress protein PHOS32-like n=1 Tax=Miscanthus floridulus TaxID=154761 RepID=UPI00345AC14E